MYNYFRTFDVPQQVLSMTRYTLQCFIRGIFDVTNKRVIVHFRTVIIVVLMALLTI